LNQHFELHYMNDKNTRVCFFVNKRVALASYTITHRSKDLCSLALKLAEGRTINVHNIYNPCKSSEDKSNLPLLRTALGGKANEEHIVMGDFNLHHPKWGGDEVRADADAYELVVILAKEAQQQWTTSWNKDQTGRGLYALQSTPKKAVLKLHNGLTKDLSALAVQMRTGKIGLRVFLFRRKVLDTETERCQCRQAPQTVEHILFTCRKYANLRRNMWKEERKRKTWGELSLKTVLTNPHSLKKAATFMKETGLIGQFRAPIAEDY